MTMIVRRFSCGLLCGLLAGQGSVGGVGEAMASSGSSTPKMERTPGYVLAYCLRSRRLRLACPRQLPWMEQPSPHWEASACIVGEAGCRGLAWDDLSLVDAGAGNRPPVWSHIAIYAGNLTSAFPFRYPTRGRPPLTLNGLFAKTTTRAVFLGSYIWGGKHGTVVLAPSYPNGGEQGDHLIFRWRQSGVGYALGLHGWEPLQQAFATLRAMVRSI